MIDMITISANTASAMPAKERIAVSDSPPCSRFART